MNTRKYFHYMMKIWDIVTNWNILFQQEMINQFIYHIGLYHLSWKVKLGKCLDKWLKQGIIQHSASPYASQVVLVHKKSGDIRICVDFHCLNGVTV